MRVELPVYRVQTRHAADAIEVPLLPLMDFFKTKNT